MKQPEEQNQHKVPQVYLKQFGYKFKEQFKVSVLKIGEHWLRQKSIESFLAETNVFDIDSEVSDIERLFESLNGEIETEYLNIISDLEENKKLSEKSYAFLLQLITNLICRNDNWRSLIYNLLYSDIKTNFLKTICAHRSENIEDLETKDFYRIMAESPVDSIINRALLFFMEYLLNRIGHFEVVILQSQDEKPWYTSDNPVVVDSKTAALEILKPEIEIYFPINPKYLAYLHHNNSEDKENELRRYKTNTVYLVTDEQNCEIQQKIMQNAYEYVIISGELKTGDLK